MKRTKLLGLLLPAAFITGPSQASADRVAGSAPVAAPAAPSLCVGDASHGWLAQQNRVLLTRDGGRTWKIGFVGRFQQPSQFQAAIGCAGNVAWVLFIGPDAAMNQKPYVLYRTADGGTHWTAEMEEGYFSSEYPAAHVRRALGAYPGPFVVVNRSTAYFLGMTIPVGPQGAVYLSATSDAGYTWRETSVPCLSALHPFTLDFSSPRNGWIVGVCGGRRMSLVTTDGGRTWSPRPIP